MGETKIHTKGWRPISAKFWSKFGWYIRRRRAAETPSSSKTAPWLLTARTLKSHLITLLVSQNIQLYGNSYRKISNCTETRIAKYPTVRKLVSQNIQLYGKLLTERLTGCQSHFKPEFHDHKPGWAGGGGVGSYASVGIPLHYTKWNAQVFWHGVPTSPQWRSQDFLAGGGGR